MRAAQRYNPELGFKFSTYATPWIRQVIGRALQDTTDTIRTPVHGHDLRHKLYQTFQQLGMTLGRDPTIEELSASTGTPPQTIKLLFQAAAEILSLDQEHQLEDGDSGGFGELLPADESPVEEQVGINLNNEQLKAALEALSPREEFILRWRYGLVNGEQHTLEEVGHKFKITRERVRQIEKKAFKRLKRRIVL